MSKKLSSPRIVGLLFWSLLPSLAIWLGLYVIKSAAWAYALYHGIFLIPAIIWARALWKPTFKMPSLKDCALLFVVAILFSALTVVSYEVAGKLVLSDSQVSQLLKEQGLEMGNLLGFGLYATIVNPLVEEIFWRGVVLNALDDLELPWKHFGIVFSSLAYALFHYLIFRLVLYPIAAEIGILLLAAYGALLAIIYRRTGSIVTTAIAHGLWTDLACVALLLDFYRRYPTL